MWYGGKGLRALNPYTALIIIQVASKSPETYLTKWNRLRERFVTREIVLYFFSNMNNLIVVDYMTLIIPSDQIKR